jgi:uncharacterized protein YyaL (SSP411 family)
MPNHLAHETSPYLLQHRNNPVDWYPWGEEALAKARREEKPIFLSIGYSACHWCHVMAHESFENKAIARLLNEHFVSIKVDREERPDLDQIYMNAVQMLTGRGGWPMSVFLTPELKPFYGGTYFPPHSAGGMPGFDQVLTAVADAWANRRAEALAGAEQITVELRKIAAVADVSPVVLSRELIDQAVAELRRAFDPTWGGFGTAPKFPNPMDLELLLALHQRSGRNDLLDMVRVTLDRMAAGGIYDHLGGGFARYAVDQRWLVPHFEKMLYDNALLARAYLDAYLVTGNDDYARVVRETLDYVLRDMTMPCTDDHMFYDTPIDGGVFYSTEDADSEGEEGRFYTWTPTEIEAVLGPDATETFCRVYDVTESGNFEGRNVLSLPKTLQQCATLLGREPDDLQSELADSRAKLLAARGERIRPHRDDKIIVAWNGLMIDVMARAWAPLDKPEYVFAADAAAEFILTHLRREDGRLLHTWRAGTAKLDAYLDDYSSLANALVTLYEATGNEQWIDEAAGLMDIVLDKFADRDGGGFFYTAVDHEQLITRSKELTDSSTPSGNALAAMALLRLGRLLGRRDCLDAAEATLAAAIPILQRAPLAAGQMLLALDLYLGPAYELVLVGDLERDDSQAVLPLLQRRYLPRCVSAHRLSEPENTVAHHSTLLDGLFAGKESATGEPTLHVCQDFACQSPAVGLTAIEAQLDALAAPSAPP